LNPAFCPIHRWHAAGCGGGGAEGLVISGQEAHFYCKALAHLALEAGFIHNLSGILVLTKQAVMETG